MKKYFDVYDFEKAMKAEKEKTWILPGNNYFIGKDEKRRNKEIIHIDFKYSYGNYALFYKGNNEILKNACIAMEYLFNHSGEKLSSRKESELYKVLIQSLHITHHISTDKRKSKLNGINSLSTCCLDNAFCLERIKNECSVCSHCYSATQQKTQLALQDRNVINGIILRNIVIPEKYWKKHINKADISKFFRIESFGDVQNKIQAINYINFVNAFKSVHFAAWTKNNGIWHFAFMESGKLQNLSFIVSSNEVNKPELYHLKNDTNIDHIFTVYDNDTDVVINCGGRECMKDCIRKGKGCYYTNTEKVINEKLK